MRRTINRVVDACCGKAECRERSRPERPGDLEHADRGISRLSVAKGDESYITVQIVPIRSAGAVSKGKDNKDTVSGRVDSPSRAPGSAHGPQEQ
jgi:hypothetical protein